jgi:hypothetical protein
VIGWGTGAVTTEGMGAGARYWAKGPAVPASIAAELLGQHQGGGALEPVNIHQIHPCAPDFKVVKRVLPDKQGVGYKHQIIIGHDGKGIEGADYLSRIAFYR